MPRQQRPHRPGTATAPTRPWGSAPGRAPAERPVRPVPSLPFPSRPFPSRPCRPAPRTLAGDAGGMSGAGAAVLAWALLAGALLPAPPVRPQPLPHGDRKVQEKEAQFNTTYIDWVDANLLNIYAFNHSVRRNRVSRGGRHRRVPPGRLSPGGAGALGCAGHGSLYHGGRAKSSLRFEPPRPDLPGRHLTCLCPRRPRACGCRSMSSRSTRTGPSSSW